MAPTWRCYLVNGVCWCHCSTYHTKQPNSSASRVLNYNQLPACPGETDNHLKTMQSSSHSMQSRTPVCMTSFRNIHSKSSLENFQHSHSPELYSLSACSYSYINYLMVKSVSCCSVHAWKPLCSFLAIWLATYFFVIPNFLLNSKIKVYNLVHTIKTVIAKFDLFALY